ncbi:hypothetical protein, partial [Mesorhizobium sp.]|uniref:hypothetical protein n=1 Tax=Mesorhizobium sp. TaxID=1871066 RepID=UPI0025BEC144
LWRRCRHHGWRLRLAFRFGWGFGRRLAFLMGLFVLEQIGRSATLWTFGVPFLRLWSVSRTWLGHRNIGGRPGILRFLRCRIWREMLPGPRSRLPLASWPQRLVGPLRQGLIHARA